MRRESDIVKAIDEHADTVLRVCMLYLANHHDAEDAFQTTFIKYSQSDVTFNDGEHRKAWLIRVAKNVCLDMRKAASRKDIAFETSETGDSLYGSHVDCYPSEQVDETLEAMYGLPDEQREVLYLIYYEQYPATQVATILDKPVNTVYTLAARGRKKLREVLGHGRS